jgi:hypothetical protein
VTFRVWSENLRDRRARGTALQFQLPRGMRQNVIAPDACTVSGDSVDCQIGRVPGHETRSL